MARQGGRSGRNPVTFEGAFIVVPALTEHCGFVIARRLGVPPAPAAASLAGRTPLVAVRAVWETATLPHE
ncbi:MAG TPA: hypothetical protein VIL32_01230 [Steroidobacteraceae bacterium]